ncbi:hypothetical protein T01_12370 [Trichinella spiralis]|uniref:Uncharacterized protein n=1 Tax=Trichinella spiralis TaxID=6334 RepID=A0A0V1BJB9_TRISP|nr:hypothetical protein T01_12370 [Trichinella spiralis]
MLVSPVVEQFVQKNLLQHPNTSDDWSVLTTLMLDKDKCFIPAKINFLASMQFKKNFTLIFKCRDLLKDAITIAYASKPMILPVMFSPNISTIPQIILYFTGIPRLTERKKHPSAGFFRICIS